MIKLITFKEASNFLSKFHYINADKGGFRSGINYGFFIEDLLIGTCIYHTISGYHTKKGMLAAEHQDKCVYEMGRLCLQPNLQENNILSKFISLTFKDLKVNHPEIDYILSYADSKYHSGKIYQALNMGYYGITSKRRDFWFKLQDGTYKKQRRGVVSGQDGEWRPRTQKYRYVKCLKKKYDKFIIWEKESYKNIPMRKQTFNKYFGSDGK